MAYSEKHTAAQERILNLCRDIVFANLESFNRDDLNRSWHKARTEIRPFGSTGRDPEWMRILSVRYIETQQTGYGGLFQLITDWDFVLPVLPTETCIDELLVESMNSHMN